MINKKSFVKVNASSVLSLGCLKKFSNLCWIMISWWYIIIQKRLENFFEQSNEWKWKHRTARTCIYINQIYKKFFIFQFLLVFSFLLNEAKQLKLMFKAADKWGYISHSKMLFWIENKHIHYNRPITYFGGKSLGVSWFMCSSNRAEVFQSVFRLQKTTTKCIKKKLLQKQYIFLQNFLGEHFL